jgi:KaiC/GvpD/RAD55 family RecA-like ATPase
VTTFLVGEYGEPEVPYNPVFTVADGILWLFQSIHGNSSVRKIQIMKMRGRAAMPGLHTFRIINEGFRQGEPGVIVVFEEHPDAYLARAKRLGVDLEEMTRQNELKVIYLRPLDLSVDETLEAIRAAVELIDARRVVIDSLSGFELALAPTFREDFRESMYRLVGSLTGVGVTAFVRGSTPARLVQATISASIIVADAGCGDRGTPPERKPRCSPTDTPTLPYW